MTKKSVLWIGIIGMVLFFVAMFPVDAGICVKSNYDCRTISDLIQNILGVFPFVLFFSIITYKMREEVFQAWWQFARWFVPVIIVATWLINSQGGGNGSGIAGAIGKGFDNLVLGIFYAIFVITSVVKIVLAYRKGK